MHRSATLSGWFFFLTVFASGGAYATDPDGHSDSDNDRWTGGSIPRLQIGSDRNSGNLNFVQPGECAVQGDGSLVCQDPAASGGGRDQSLQFFDILAGSRRDDLQIGGLGADLLVGSNGNDVQLGGLEHFFPLNRDKSFGGRGSDIFIWKPGDGSDFFSGGRGRDAVVFGVVGEDEGGKPVFEVVGDRLAGEVFIDSKTGLPRVDVSGSPGFCDVVDRSTSPDAAAELDALGLDHLVRFSIRGVADAFARGDQDTDNGLRVTLHLVDVEFVVCTNRDGGKIEVLDLTASPPRRIGLEHVRPWSLKKRLQQMVF